MRSSLVWFSGALAVAASACQPSETLPGSSATGTGGSGGMGPIVYPPDPPPTCGRDPGPAPMRLLGPDEYDNSLGTLLPQMTFTQPPSQALPASAPWPNQYDGLLALTPASVEAYLDVATDLGRAQRGAVGAALLNTGCQVAGAAPQNNDDDCARGLASWFGKRAYRRPLFDEETEILLGAYRAGRAIGGSETGVMALVAAVLQAPQFLYRIEFGEQIPTDSQRFRPTAHEMAARLASLVWADLPDDELVRAADDGRLVTADAVAAQVRRMTADARAHALATRFFGGWIPFDGLFDAPREPALFPTFTDAVRRDMRRETERFVDYQYWETDSSVRSLLTAPLTFVTPALAAHYGLPPLPDGDELTMVSLDPARRGGLLTQGSLMTSLAYDQCTSPVRRGEFILNHLQCAHLPPPPASVPAVPPEPPANATTRQRLEIHSANPVCAACHHLIDPQGFAFEHFDQVGRWRDTENGFPIDSSGFMDVPFFATPTVFTGAMDLANELADSDRVRACMVSSWFQFAFGREPDATADACSLEAMTRGFAAGGYRIRDLIPLVTQTEAFLYRRALGDQP